MIPKYVQKNFIEMCDKALQHPLVKESEFLRDEISKFKKAWQTGDLSYVGYNLGAHVGRIFEDRDDQGLGLLIGDIDPLYQMRREGRNWKNLVD